MKIYIKHIFIACLMGVSGQSVLAQTEFNVDGEVQDAEIVIEKERKIELNKEYKLYEFIKWKPATATPVAKPSEFKWYVYDVTNEPMQFAPAKAKVQQRDKSYQHYGKAGFGNYTSPLLDVSMTTAGDANQMAGLNIKHESFGTGEVDGKNSGTAASEINLYGAMLRKQIKLESSLNYRLEKNYYYGYPTGSVVNNSDIKHNANFINLGLSATDNELEDAWSYSAGVNFRHYSDNFDASENTFLTNIGVGFNEQFFLDADLALSKYADTGIDESRSYVRLNPYYRLTIQGLQLDVGLSASFQNDDLPDLSSSRIFPYAKASYALTEDYTVFAKLDGGYTFNSLYDFAQEVGYLNQSVGIANSQRSFDLSGGITGNLMEQLSVTAAVGYQSVKYLPILLNNAADQSRLDLTYDPENSNIFTFNGSAQYEINEAHQVSLGVNVYGYSSSSYDQIYHRPTSGILVSGDHQIIPKLNAKWNFTFTGGLVGRDQVTDTDISLDAIPQLDLGLHYQLKEQWGIFLSGENLINKKYQRYLYYTQRGIQIKGGVTFRM